MKNFEKIGKNKLKLFIKKLKQMKKISKLYSRLSKNLNVSARKT